VVRVPLMLRDSAPVQVRLADGSDATLEQWQADALREVRGQNVFGRDGDEFALNKPGSRYYGDQEGRERVEDARNTATRLMCDAWRHPVRDAGRDDPVTGFGATAGEAAPSGYSLTGAREGDICTVRSGGVDEGAPGRLRMVNGALVCVADPGFREQEEKREDDTMDAREAAYREYCRELSDAWKGK